MYVTEVHIWTILEKWAESVRESMFTVAGSRLAAVLANARKAVLSIIERNCNGRDLYNCFLIV